MLHEHDELMAECVLSNDGSVDPQCSAIATALDSLQETLDARGRTAGQSKFPQDARTWVDEVLLAEPCPASLQEQKTILFGECVLGEPGQPSHCELLEEAIGAYCELVATVRLVDTRE